MTYEDGAGPSVEVAMEFGTQHDAEVAIAAAADDLDAVGSSMPSGDLGDAAVVVDLLMSAFTDTAVRLVTEAKVLALGVRVATGEMTATDDMQAVDFMGVDRRGATAGDSQ